MRRPTGAARLATVLLALVPAALAAQANPLGDWPQHSKARPRPPVVAPGTGALPVPPPADAIVLFDGKNLDEWQKGDSTPAQWRLVEGQAMQVTAGKGGIETKRRFGDAQLHIEWASPKPAKGTDQDRGNSGVFFQGRYEVQVLDSYGNDTYPDGQAAAIYGQYPPLVNASRAPGEWQSYDIIFRRPRGGQECSWPPRVSRCSTTGCWCRITSPPWGRRHTRRVRRTKHMPTGFRSVCRTTDIPCASGTSGSAISSRPAILNALPRAISRSTRRRSTPPPRRRARPRTCPCRSGSPRVR